jgi:hypothetical protein
MTREQYEAVWLTVASAQAEGGDPDRYVAEIIAILSLDVERREPVELGQAARLGQTELDGSTERARDPGVAPSNSSQLGAVSTPDSQERCIDAPNFDAYANPEGEVA